MSARSLLRGLADRMLVFAVLIILTFLLPRLMPGDPLELLLSSDSTRGLSGQELEMLRNQYGLAGSWLQQFQAYVAALLRGDLGYSLRHAMPVADLILASVPWTLLLVLSSLPVYLFFGIYAGIVAGRSHRHMKDHLVSGGMILLASLPPFAAAVFLQLLFAVIWPVLPVTGAEPLFPSSDTCERAFGIVRHAVLPVVALALHEVTRFFFLARGEAASLSSRAFVLNARARGLRGWTMDFNYYGRNLLPQVLARLGDSITTLFGAVFFVEVVFSYPGIGSLIYAAMLERDYILLQGGLLAMAVVVLALNWGLDILVDRLVVRG